MWLSHVVPFLSILSTAIALTSPPTRGPTGVADNAAGLLDGWTPKPTTPPVRFGVEKKQSLFGRADAADVCGYFEGDPQYPNKCATGSECAFFTKPNWYFACCATSSDGSFGDDCFDVGACTPYSSGTVATPVISDNAVFCGSDLPSCDTTYFIDAAVTPDAPRTHYNCVTQDGDRVYHLYQDSTSVSVLSKSIVSTEKVTVTVTQTPGIQDPSAETIGTSPSTGAAMPVETAMARFYAPAFAAAVALAGIY